MSAAGVALRLFIAGFLRPVERLLPSQWCEKHIELPPGKGETKPGAVSFVDRPYQREPLDSFADPTVTDIVFVGPTRIGKTFFLRMGLAWSIAGDPAPTLWVDATEDKGKDVSKKELRPMIEYNSILRERKPVNRHNVTDLQILFPGAAFTIVGGNSPAQVAGDTVKRTFGNELDKWSDATAKEASIAELLRHRTESFEDERKHGWSSTPTIEQAVTWQYFLRGDQRKWQCVCPRCETLQALEWDNVKWDPLAKQANGKWDLARVKASARYSCINAACAAHDPDGSRGTGWTDAERVAAIQDVERGARWLPTAVGQPGWRSYHVNGLYGPLKTNSCGELAVDFLAAKNAGFLMTLQDFWNSRMGLPWLDNVSDLTVSKFALRESPPKPWAAYFRGEIPAGFDPEWVIIGVDVQSNRLPYVVRAGDWAGNSFTVDHGNAPTWKDLDQVQVDYQKRLGAPSSFLIVDVNYEERRAETLERIYERKHRGWFGAEGFELAKDRVRLEGADVFLGGKLANKGHKIVKLVISLYEFKVELEKRFAGEIANWFSYQLPPLGATDVEAEEQVEYYKQLLDERRVPRRPAVQGKPPTVFKSRSGNNHFFDCEVYILALFWTLQKSRSYVARKKQATGERKTVEVSTS
jgi:phage terminase large subunit GpA-like protein